MSNGDHTVIAGGGRVGRRVAGFFADRGDRVTIVEKDEATIANLERDDVELVRGNATRPSMLEEALTEETRVLGALTDRGDTNLAICMVAKQLQPELRTVARIESEFGDEYSEFVDKVFFPERASVKAAVNALSGSDIRTLEEVTGRLELLDIRVDFDAPIKGKRVSEIDLPTGAVIISRANGDVTVQQSTKLVGGRRYIVAADNEVVDDVISLFRGE